MTCYSPITAFRLIGRKTENNKDVIVFRNPTETHEKIDLPCGQCIGCRTDKSKQWAIRCVHESLMFLNNCFITLTFDEENIDANESLVKSDFQKFMKRLRKKNNGFEQVKTKKGSIEPIRYFHCGEYGIKLSRPHHHACIFNFDFRDKKLYTIRDEVRLYRSEEFEELWPFGFSTIGDVTYESAAYCARYITKKITGKKAEQHYRKIDTNTGEIKKIQSEYITSSRRPGIGKTWYDKYKTDVYPKDFTTIKGKKLRSPGYYDKLYETENKESLDKIKRKRKIEKCKRKENNTLVRLKVKRTIKQQLIKRLVRSVEQ